MVTDVKFVQIARLAEYLDAEALLDYLCGVLVVNFAALVAMKDFTSKDMSYRVMGRLLEGFSGSDEDRLVILAHWSRDWDGDPTDLQTGGTLCPLMRTVDLTKVSADALKRAHTMMPASAFGALDASFIYKSFSEKQVVLRSQQALAVCTRPLTCPGY